MMLKVKLIILLFFGINIVAKAQLINPADTANNYRKADTVCYKLNFIPLDTLVYKVVSFDSISINFDTPLLKNRVEKWQIVCKAIDKHKRFILGIKMIEYKSKETYKNTADQEVYDSPWLNHEVLISVDSLGDRYYIPVNDTVTEALGPGGAFQPILVFPFLRGCKPINQTWLVNSTDTLVENGYPVPVMKQVSLFRLNPLKDTLNDTCAVLEFVKSGQGVLLSAKAGLKMNITSVINSFGELYLSLSRHIPLQLFATSEQKLTIHLPGGESQPGYHYITSVYSLESYKIHKSIPPVQKKIQNKGSRKKIK